MLAFWIEVDVNAYSNGTSKVAQSKPVPHGDQDKGFADTANAAKSTQ